VRVVITGASGNVGTSLLGALADEPRIDSVVALARRRPDLDMPKTTWAEADVAKSDLLEHFAEADAVVHLAWLIQPSRDLNELRRVNVHGSRRVFETAAAAGVRALVYASSVGAYSPGPKDRGVDESWATDGISTSFYSRHKAEVEHLLDDFEQHHPHIRVVRFRPALIFKREVGSEVRRLFVGPLLPNFLLRRYLIPIVPNTRNLRFQAVHSFDVGNAYRLALVNDARGAFNIAADPVLDQDELARCLDAKQVRLSPRVLRRAASLTWRLRLQPTPVGWVDMGLQAPLIDSTRARMELDWEPQRTSKEALSDLIAGMREGAGLPTPPLEAGGKGPLRIGEFLTGVGRR
jgi:UDP-glucose 4-epimerase